MKRDFNYQLFLFISTFARGLVGIFSLVLLYQKEFSLREIFLFLLITYLTGIVVNFISLKLHFKLILILSAILYGGSFLYLSFMPNTFFHLVLLAIMQGGGNYSYHTVRHLLALYMLDKKKGSRRVVLIMYLGVILSSIVGTFLVEKFNLLVVVIIVMIFLGLSLVPLQGIPSDLKLESRKERRKVKLGREKFIFSILEQFKVIFLEVQPLYLYLSIEATLSYVGIFNVVVNVATLVFIYFWGKRFKVRNFFLVTFSLGVVFMVKLNIRSQYWMLGLAFLEGILVKGYEEYSLNNLYDLENNPIVRYLGVEEFIFFVSKCLIMLFFILLADNFKILMYLCAIGVMGSGCFLVKDRDYGKTIFSNHKKR